MLLVVNDATLQIVLGTKASLSQTWPDAFREVQYVIEVLENNAFITLADLIAVAIISLLRTTSAVRTGEVALGYRRVVVTALALDQERELVRQPYQEPERVAGLQLVDVVTSGRSAVRAAG